MAIGTYTSIITLNVNRLKAPTKTHRLNEWIQKQYLCIYRYIETHFRAKETHFRAKDTYSLKNERMEIYIPCKWEAKETWSSNPHVRQNRP